MLANIASGVAVRFDSDAQQRVAALFRSCPPEQFLRELSNYTPGSREEEVSFGKYYGWALYDAGEYPSARPHLLRALRRSLPSSRDRCVVRGLLAEQYLRTGRLDLAERCTHRALAELPEQDEGAYLRAGHLCMLGRIRRRRGHVTHAIETHQRALALVDEHSPHWSVLTASLVVALLQRGHVHEADALIRAHRQAAERGACASQVWVITSAEGAVAMALGDIERAERVLDEALARHGSDAGERVRFALLEPRAAAFRARGDWTRSEELLRSILDRCELNTRNGDLVASSARGLAESLEGQRRFEAALQPARNAVRAGSLEDWSEWATGLHVLGRCLAALRRTDEARRVFQEALGLHERTQFDAERSRLERTLVRLGFESLARSTSSSSSHLRRISLADGRAFLTLDRRLLDDVRSAAASDLPVLLEGETGTGKELVARLLHEQGPLARGPFVVVDCATLSHELADVELFGAARGAYTGAHRDRPGLVAQAHDGTLFLDELPELSSALQAKLLRVLQEGSYRRVGEVACRQARVRFVAATNRSIDDLLRSGALRPDLFYRLNGHRITLEPLRERRREIGPLAEEFVRRSGLAGITPAALRALEAYHWPGNTRQLEMILRVAARRCEPGRFLHWEDLVIHEPGTAVLAPGGDSLRAGRAAWEKATLVRALQESGGVVAKAARSLGLTRQAMYLAMRRTGITRGDIRVS
jgi:DNA-binding NtrC family response regulator/Flp pilus assembly protein TadD